MERDAIYAIRQLAEPRNAGSVAPAERAATALDGPSAGRATDGKAASEDLRRLCKVACISRLRKFALRAPFILGMPLPFRTLQMQGAPEVDTGSVHERTLRMATEEQRRRWGVINGSSFST